MIMNRYFAVAFLNFLGFGVPIGGGRLWWLPFFI